MVRVRILMGVIMLGCFGTWSEEAEAPLAWQAPKKAEGEKRAEQEKAPAPRAKEEPEPPLPPVPAVGTPAQASALWGRDALPIDLMTALRLSQTSNLDIAQARQVVEQAQAILERAWALTLPSLSLGSTYVDHDGKLQQAVGNILNTNRNSLFVGGGPQVLFQMSDAVFAPLAARQVVAATQAGQRRVTNDTLLTVAEAYFHILRARRRIAAIQETILQLTEEKPSSIRGQSKGLLPLVRDVVEVGGKDAFRSDLERVRVEVYRREQELEVAIQDYRMAMAELARILHLDPTIPLWPIEDFRQPLSLPGDAWSTQELEDLVLFALNNRPEIAENQALVQAAVNRLRAARLRPLVPNVAVNFSYAAFGGSPNFLIKDPARDDQGLTRDLTQSGRIDDFGPRTDFDVGLYWRLQNLGFGNQADVREQRAVRNQAQIRVLQMQDRIVTQVVQAQEQVQRGRQRIDITRISLFDSGGGLTGPAFRSLRLNFERIRGAEGRPLEVIDSIRGLADLLDAYGAAVTDYERARFRLLVALGVPPHGFTDPAAMPLPPGVAPTDP